MAGFMNVRLILLAGVLFAAPPAWAEPRRSPHDFAALESHSHETERDLRQNSGVAPGASDAVGNPFARVPLESLTATRERPLFSATRRPPPSADPVPEAKRQAPLPAQAPPPAEPQGPPLTLIGTITGAEHPVAILFNKLTRIVATIHEGDEALGWRVTSVSARSAIIEKDGAAVTLSLPKPGDAIDPAAGAAADQ